MLSVANEEIEFLNQASGPRWGSMSGNGKILPPRRGCRGQEMREKKAGCSIDEDAGQGSEYDLSADPDALRSYSVRLCVIFIHLGVMRMTEVEVGDDRYDEMKDPWDPRDRRRKEGEFTINIPHHIPSIPTVQEVTGQFPMSNNQVCPTITKLS